MEQIKQRLIKQSEIGKNAHQLLYKIYKMESLKMSEDEIITALEPVFEAHFELERELVQMASDAELPRKTKKNR